MLPPDPSGQIIALDLETTGLEWWKDNAFLMALSYPDGSDHYLDLRDPNQVQWAKDHVHRAAALVNHNIKFDLHFLLKMGIRFPATLHDTMVYAALIFEHHNDYGLDYLGKRYVDVGKDDSIYQRLSDLFGGNPDKKTQMPNLHRAPLSLVGPYAMQDTRTALKLWDWQMGELERQGLGRVREMEMRLLPVLLKMEHGGVRVDVPAAEAAIPEITKFVDGKQRELDDLLGRQVNVNSPKQMATVFNPRQLPTGWWQLEDGTLTAATDSGKAAKIDANALRLSKHPAAPIILEIKVFKKIRDTFLKGHVLGSQVNGYVHTTYNQTRTDTDGDLYGTGSGRMSSSNPNLQQVSKRNKRACEVVRKLFLPDPGAKWFSVDFAQIDFRVMAHYLALTNRQILDTYEKDPMTDFHQMVANFTGLPRNPTPESRASAKTINLGLSFGMGQGRLAEEMGLPFVVEPQPDGRVFKKAGAEALAIFDQYHQNLPGLKDLLKQASNVAKERGYIRTILGRRCRFPGGEGTHKAGALIFQGGAAELMKMKMIELDEAQGPSRMMLNVHDASDFSVPDESEAPRLQEIFNRNTIGLRVPICSEWKIGDNWLEAT